MQLDRRHCAFMMIMWEASIVTQLNNWQARRNSPAGLDGSRQNLPGGQGRSAGHTNLGHPTERTAAFRQHAQIARRPLDSPGHNATYSCPPRSHTGIGPGGSRGLAATWKHTTSPEAVLDLAGILAAWTSHGCGSKGVRRRACSDTGWEMRRGRIDGGVSALWSHDFSVSQ